MKSQIAGSLRGRVLILVLLGFAAVAAPAYAAFNWIVDTTIVQLGTLFAEKQVLYDRYRGLQALTREVTLAETLAGSQSIRDWANNESDPALMRRGIAELEHYRQSFADGSYFFAIGDSGHYYFNDAANSYAGEQLRYTLDPQNPRDSWYFSTAALGAGCHLNVDNDANLRVTKVWMNCVIREGNRVLGILGTGLDLSSFIQDVVNIPQAGVTSLFVDRQGAIQAYRDENLVNLRSLMSEMSDKRSVFSLVDTEAGRAALRELMDSVSSGAASVQSRFVSIDGKQALVGVGYLEQLGWFNVTVMDVDAIINKRIFLPIGLLLAAVMGVVAVVMVLVFNRQVLDRVAGLEHAVRRARAGDYGPALVMGDGRPDEIGRLSAAFTEMAVAVSDHTQLLEDRVRARTEDLARLAFLDAATGLANRRGFADAFDKLAPNKRHGLLLVDVDHFKTINDSYGHAAGDMVISEIGRRITQTCGPGAIGARWGGDEYAILLADSAPHLLRAAAFAIMASVSDRPVELADGRSVIVTVSMGACLIEPREAMETAVDMADTALYMAKHQGRNKVVVFDSENGASGSRASG